MEYVRFKRQGNEYVIENSNSDDLSVIGKLLISTQPRTTVKELISTSLRWPSDWPSHQQTHDLSAKEAQCGSFYFKKYPSNLIDISLNDTQGGSLEVSIDAEMLGKLIKEWERYQKEGSQQLALFKMPESDALALTDQPI